MKKYYFPPVGFGFWFQFGVLNSINDDYLHSIFDLFEKDSTGLPKFYPAVKRGQEVDVVFEFPLILYTN